MTQTQERITLERHLSFVIGKNVDLRRSESLWFDPVSLKRAYYRRAKELHPDRAVGLGLDPAVMTERFRSLQDSYEAVLDFLDSGRLELLLRELSMRENSGCAGRAGCSVDADRSSRQGRPDSRKSGGTGASTPSSPGFGPGARTHNRAQSNAGPRANGGARSAAGSRSSAAGYHQWNAGAGQTAGRTFYRGKIPPFRLRLAEWLYYTGRVSFESLIAALAWQYSERPKVGSIAVGLGYLEQTELDTIIRCRLLGEPFCSAAVRLGYLNPFERSVVLGRQRLMNQPIGSYFTERCILSIGQLEQAVRDLWAHNMRVPSRAAV